MTPEALRNKLALGTVQLGLSYGISNTSGKPSREDAFHILDRAWQSGINLLDSAEAYGDSVAVIGSYLRVRPEAHFKIVSKFIEDQYSLEDKLSSSMNLLGRSHLYAYLYHRFSDYQVGKNKSFLRRLKTQGVISKWGVSIYGMEELRKVVADPEVDLFQIPYNIFDAAVEKKELLQEAKEQGKEIHVRSIFLQGLFFKKPEELIGTVKGLAGPLTEFRRIIDERGVTIMEACLNHALHNTCIDRVVVGVEKTPQLDKNLAAVLPDFPIELVRKLESISVSDTTLLNPASWKVA